MTIALMKSQKGVLCRAYPFPFNDKIFICYYSVKSSVIESKPGNCGNFRLIYERIEDTNSLPVIFIFLDEFVVVGGLLVLVMAVFALEDNM